MYAAQDAVAVCDQTNTTSSDASKELTTTGVAEETRFSISTAGTYGSGHLLTVFCGTNRRVPHCHTSGTMCRTDVSVAGTIHDMKCAGL